MSNYTTRAERVDFQLAPGYFLELYRLPSGEKRIGIASAAVICGHKRNYFNTVKPAVLTQWEALQGMGFTVYVMSGIAERRSKKIVSIAQTFTLEDFSRFVCFSAFDLGKKPALLVANALKNIAIESVARQAFTEEVAQDAQIREYFCKEFANIIELLQEDPEDGRVIDEHTLFLHV